MSGCSTFWGMKGAYFSPEAVRMLAESRTHSEQSGFFNNTIWTVGPIAAFWAHSVCSTGEHVLGGVKDALFAPTYLFKSETKITVLNIPKHLLLVPYKSLEALTARWADAIFSLVASTAITITVIAFAILGFGRGSVAHSLLGTAKFASNDPLVLRRERNQIEEQASQFRRGLDHQRVEGQNIADQLRKEIQETSGKNRALRQEITETQEQVLRLQQAADPVRQMFLRAGAADLLHLIGDPERDVAAAYRAKVAEGEAAVDQLNAAIDTAQGNLQAGSLAHDFLAWLRANCDNTFNWVAADKHEEVHGLRNRITQLEAAAAE